MKSPLLIVLISALFIVSCGSKESKTQNLPKKESAEKHWKTNKGVGPVTEVVLKPINPAIAKEGETLYKSKCIACHKTTSKRLIGPGLGKIMSRRTPEWTMNMIINPQKMIKEDPIGIELYQKFKTPMLGLGIDEKEARIILEYLRTL